MSVGQDLGGGAPRLHFEYGLTQNLTLGITGWGGTDGTSGEVLAFTRRKIPTPLKNWHIAAEIGGGRHRSSLGKERPVVSLGIGAGRGLPRGWLDLSAQLTFDGTNPADWRGTDQLSIGHNVTDQLAVMGQLRGERLGYGDTKASGALFAIWRVHPAVRLVAEAEQEFKAPSPDLRVSLWSEF